MTFDDRCATAGDCLSVTSGAPAWLKKALRKLAPKGKKQEVSYLWYRNLQQLEVSICKELGFEYSTSLFDHIGRSGDVFVTEPYLDIGIKEMRVLVEMAKRLECEILIKPLSWHATGSTTRIEFHEKECD